jgi:hypothetical protein
MWYNIWYGCCGGRPMRAAESEIPPALAILEERFAKGEITRRSSRRSARSFPNHGKSSLPLQGPGEAAADF